MAWGFLALVAGLVLEALGRLAHERRSHRGTDDLTAQRPILALYSDRPLARGLGVSGVMCVLQVIAPALFMGPRGPVDDLGSFLSAVLLALSVGGAIAGTAWSLSRWQERRTMASGQEPVADELREGSQTQTEEA